MISSEQLLEGAMYNVHVHLNFLGSPLQLFFFFWGGGIAQEMDGFRQTIYKAFRIQRTLFYKHNPLEMFFPTISPNHNLTLKVL